MVSESWLVFFVLVVVFIVVCVFGGDMWVYVCCILFLLEFFDKYYMIGVGFVVCLLVLREYGMLDMEVCEWDVII